MTSDRTAAKPAARTSEGRVGGGLRERKKLSVRRALVAAAQKMVLERGIDATTVDEVCQKAGIARRTFFNYFDSKDDAALGSPGQLVPDDAAAVFAEGGPAGQLPSDVETLARAILTTKDFDAVQARRRAEILRREPKLLVRQLWWFERELQRLRDSFASRAQRTPMSVDPEVGALAVLGLTRGSFRLWESSGESGQIVDHLPEAVHQFRALFALAPD